MKVKTFVGKGLAENTYVYYDGDNKRAVIIDPGVAAGKAAMWAKDEKLNVLAVLLTHGHFDHIEGIFDVSAIYPDAKVYVGEHERRFMSDANLNGSATECAEPITINDCVFAGDNALFDYGGIIFNAVFTPGHTEGGVCWLDDANAVIFTGDTLFFNDVGATHYATGDWNTLQKSIKEKLYTLGENVKVYPGHGARTTIKEEKHNNPHVRIETDGI